MDQQDSLNPRQKPGLIPGPRGGMLHAPFGKGNPGGSAPRGKRISTWMAEFGELPPSKWPSAKKLQNMPSNAGIALARLKKALELDGIRDTELILERTEGAVTAEPSLPMIEAIAAAIRALKASGVDIRRTALEGEAVENVMMLPTQSTEPIQKEDEDEDGDMRSKRFRRGRS